MFVDDLPTEETDSAYEVACEWGGQRVTGIIRVHYREVALPIDPEEYERGLEAHVEMEKNK